MALTANGHILYGTSTYNSNGTYTYALGLIGGNSLSVSPTNLTPTVYAGTDQTINLSQSASLSATAIGSTSGLPIAWTTVSGPAGVSLTSSGSTGSAIASFSAPGIYQLRATVTDGAFTGSDEINITVQPDPAAVSVTATTPTAFGGGASGQLVFSRTGTPSGALVVNYTIAGTAQSGVDYAALPGTVTIPDGAASVAVPVLAMPNPTPNSTVIFNVATSASYEVGVSQQAVVTLQVAAPTNFSAWSSSNLSGYAPNLQVPTADPANDGIPNLIKYALNLDPTKNVSQGLPFAAISAPINGQNYLTLSYTEVPNATDIGYVVQVSSDLVNWSSGSSATTQVSSTPKGDGTSTVVARDLMPITGGSRRFMRLQITQP